MEGFSGPDYPPTSTKMKTLWPPPRPSFIGDAVTGGNQIRFICSLSVQAGVVRVNLFQLAHILWLRVKGKENG